MPPRTPKACRVRGCRHTTTDPSGYCESHKSEGWKQYKPGQSRHQRGYGSKWDGIGTRILRDPYTNKPFVGFYTTKRTGGMLVDSQAIKLLKIAVA